MENIQQKIFESSSYNLLGGYITFLLNLLNTFLIARLINIVDWGLFIFAQSFVMIGILICNFSPPAIESSIQYYIPLYLKNDETSNKKVRALIFHAYRLKLFFSVVVLITFFFLLSIIYINQTFYPLLIIILPIIFFQALQNLNCAILIAFKRYKMNFYVMIFNSIIYSTLIITFYLLQIHNSLFLISYAFLISFVLSSILSLLTVRKIIPNKDIFQKKKVPDKFEFKKIHKNYGSYLVISALLTQLVFFLIKLILEQFNFISYITLLSICISTEILISSLSISNENIYVPIFSKIYVNGDLYRFKSLFYQLNKYLILLACFITGFMFYFSELYITIVYSKNYLIIVAPLQIFIFSAIFNTLLRNFGLIMRSTNQTRAILKISIVKIIILTSMPIFFFFLFNFFVFIVVYVVSTFLISIISFYIVNKKTIFRIELYLIYKPIIFFLISFILSYLISITINIQFPSFFIYLELIVNSICKFSIFTILFYIILVYPRYVTREQINQIIKHFPVFRWNKKIIKKFKNFILKFFPTSMH